MGAKPLRIAIASSGLGHIYRGVESWAADTAAALKRRGQDVALFQGAGQPAEDWQHHLPCYVRTSREAHAISTWARRFGGWRLGLGSPVQVEQTTFAWRLWWRIRRGFDILHVQEPLVALWMDRLYRLGLSRPRVILGHGTEEEPQFLRRLTFLQHLAPHYHQEWEKVRPPWQLSFAIPNFIDTAWFCPGDPRAARASWGLPQGAFTVLCVAAIRKYHKRIDFLVHEFAGFRESSGGQALLLVAGGRESDTAEVVELGRRLLGDQARFLVDVPRSKMPSLYRTADVFALTSLNEMLGIAVLEAAACALPILCHHTPVLKWVAGPGGLPADLSQPGVLAGLLTRLENDSALRQRLSQAARSYAEENFSEPVVIRQILAMYEQVMAAPRRRRRVATSLAGA